jgi:YVTN family beta-propeller protein
VPVERRPVGVAYNSAKKEIFVANSYYGNMGHGTVSVISDSTNKIVATIKVGSEPYFLAYDSKKGEMFVINHGDGTVSVISDSSNSVITTLTLSPLAYQPWGVAYNPRKDEVYVSDSAIGGVIAISDQSNTVVANVTPGTIQSNGLSYSKPLGIAYDNAKDEIFVAMNQAKKVYVISDVSNKPVSPSPTVPEFNSAFLVLVTATIAITCSAWIIATKDKEKKLKSGFCCTP